jgi:hypothetical protein
MVGRPATRALAERRRAASLTGMRTGRLIGELAWRRPRTREPVALNWSARAGPASDMVRNVRRPDDCAETRFSND